MGKKVRQHYIPQCYLKKWLDEDDKLYLCQKNDISKKEYIGIESILYENNFYTLTINDRYLLTDEDAKKIFSCLENCKIFLDGELLDTYKKCIFRIHPDTDSGDIRTAFRNYPDSVTAHPDTLSR